MAERCWSGIKVRGEWHVCERDHGHGGLCRSQKDDVTVSWKRRPKPSCRWPTCPICAAAETDAP